MDALNFSEEYTELMDLNYDEEETIRGQIVKVSEIINDTYAIWEDTEQ